MALKTKSIKSPPDMHDGLRISIMSRHTLNDGETLDDEITDLSYDQWWRELGPPTWLIRAYYKKRDPLAWEEFEEEFNYHLSLPWAQELMYRLIRMAKESDVTILCVEATPEECHRRLVAEACQKIDSDLEVIIK